MPGSTDLRVVMVVATDVAHDSRVRNEAAALAGTGAQVTVLGVAADGLPSKEAVGGATIVRVAVPYPLREERERSRKARRDWRPPLVGYRHRSTYAARDQRIRAALMEIKADSGTAIRRLRSGQGNLLTFKAGVAARLLRRARWQVAQRAALARRRIGTATDKAFKSGWRAYDGMAERLPWPVPWRTLYPEALDLETAFGELIDCLEPDVVHAHTVHVIGVAVRAAGRAKLRGHDLDVVYDAHEYVAGLPRYGPRARRSVAAWAKHEAEYIEAVDRVITSSSAIATRLQREHRLRREPAVVMSSADPVAVPLEVPDIRGRIGLAPDVPLLAYSGGVTHSRGLQTAVQALVDLPDAHLAVICVPAVAAPAVRALQVQASQVGAGDRLHCLDPVRPEEVVAFLRTADIGLIPSLRSPSDELVLPAKLFEYAVAGLPVVVSDMPSLKELVERTRIGQVFVAADANDLVAKVRSVLGDLAGYREQVAAPSWQDFRWSGQATKLRALYADLTGRRVDVAAEDPAKTERHLLIGPLNSAGQAYQWATAAERNLKGITAESLSIRSAAFRFPVHRSATEEQYRSDLRWQLDLTGQVLRDVTHVIFEAGRTMFGAVRGQVWTAEVPVLEAAGIRHAVLFHGSEIRDPARHRERHRHSPFRNPDDELTHRLQTANDMLRRHLVSYQGPVFVSTPDLLEFVDNGIWLPLALDVEGFASNRPVLDRKVPVVLHAPTSGALKGSSYIDPVLTGLDARGLIKYQRVQNVAHAELTEMVRNADIVVEQLLLGLYGVSACEAMAAGRVTVGYVPDRIRKLLPLDLPIVEATPENLAEVIERLVHERDGARKIAAAGPRYVRELHDGRRSAAALLPFLDGELA